MKISDFSISRPITTLMALMGVLVFGMYSYGKLRISLLPEITYPTMTITTEYEGAAPEEVENLISIPIEESLGVVSNLERLSSVSRAGQSEVVLEFSWGTNMDLATLDVREKLDQVFLPEDAGSPLIYRMNPDLDPILRLGLYGDQSLVDLREIAEDEIKRNLDGTPGIAAVKIRGGLEEEIQVTVDQRKMATYNLSLEVVATALAQQNINLAGGKLRDGDSEYIIRTLNEFTRVDEIGRVVVSYSDGRVIYLNDIAQVVRINKDRQVITRINGKECVEVGIYKEADANTVSVAETAKRALGLHLTPAELQQREKLREMAASGKLDRRMRMMVPKPAVVEDLPENTHIEVLTDSSRFIESSINEVRGTAFYGGILAILVLYFFLRNLTSTFIISVAIPFSIVATFFMMYLQGLSLNIMSLGGLALGIGMLVDNSIVVLEAIFRYREEGLSNRDAASRGANEVGTAVVASTLTTVAVFLPIAFVEGIAGQVFNDLAMTVVFSLFASLLISLTVIPMIAGLEFRAESIAILRSLELFREDVFRSTEGRSWPMRVVLAGWRLVRSFGYVLAGAYLRGRRWPMEHTKLFPWLGRTWLAARERWNLALTVVLFPFLVLWLGLRNAAWQSVVCFAWILRWSAAQDVIVRQQGALRKVFTGTAAVVGFLTGPLALVVRAFLLVYGCVVTIIHGILSFLGFVVLELVLFSLGVVLALAVGLTLGVAYLALLIPIILFEFLFGLVNRAYPFILETALRNRIAVVAGSIALMVWSVGIGERLGWELIPQLYQGEFQVEVKLPVGASLEDTDARVRQMEGIILNHERAQTVFSQVGTVQQTAGGNTEERENMASINVNLRQRQEQTAPTPDPEATPKLSGLGLVSTAEANAGFGLGRGEPLEVRVMEDLRDRLRNIPGVSLEFGLPSIFTFKTPIEIEITGYNLDKLQDVSDAVVGLIDDIPSIKDVRSSLEEGYPEVAIIFDREAVATTGKTVSGLAAQVRDALRGGVPTKFNEADGKLDIRVWIDEQDRTGLQALRSMPVNPDSPRPLSLDAVADIIPQTGPSEIRRIDQQRTAVVSANLVGVDLRSAIGKIQERLGGYTFPDGFSVTIAGQHREMSAAFTSLGWALLLASFLVYLVMASQFESLVQPLIIILSIPLASIGVVLALNTAQTPLSIVVFIGAIVLVGIVVNNAIVMIDFINQLREQGEGLHDAVVEAASLRLRPILMTTATTVLGLLPMAFGLGEGAEIRRPMALVICGGLLSSTLLTLVVIPVIYSIISELGERFASTEEPAA